MKKYFKKLTKGTITIFIFTAASALLGYLLKVFFAKTITNEEIGLFYSTLSFISLFLFLRDFGISDSLVFFIPKYLSRKSKSKIKSIIVLSLKVQFLMSMIFFILILIFSGKLSKFYFNNSKAQIILIFLSLYYIIDSIQEVLFRSFQGFQNMFLNQLVNFSFLFLSTLGIVLVILFNLDIVFLGLIYFFASFFNSVIFILVFVRTTFPDFFKYKTIKSKKFTKSIIKYSIPVMISNFSNQIFGNQTPLIITYFLGLDSVALYVYAYALGKIIVYFSKSINSVFAPMISEIWNKKNEKKLKNFLNNIYKYSCLINIPIALTIFIFSKEILNLLFGSVFESGSTLLKFLSFYFMLGGITSIYTVLFSNIGKPKIARNISFFLVITNLILNLILIPSLGLIGAVISDVLTNFITFIYAYKKGIKILKWHPPYKLTLFILIFSFVFFIFPFIIKIFFNINTIFKIMLSLFISFIFYTFLLFRFKIISKKEINFFFIFLRKE